MSDYIRRVKVKIDELRQKPWAEPTAIALKITGKIIGSLPPFPGQSIIFGAFNLGVSILNPDPTLADIRRSGEDIKKEIKKTFSEISSEIKNVSEQLTQVDQKISEILQIVTEIRFREGIEKIDAVYENFIDGEANMEKTCEKFKFQVADVQTNYNQHFKPEKVFTYLKMVYEREGKKACDQMFQEYLVTSAKYLQIMTIFMVYNEEVENIAGLFNRFNMDY